MAIYREKALGDARVRACVRARTIVVHPLPQQLDRRLRAVGFELGHVEVVDEDDALFAEWRAEDALAPFVELRVDDVLAGGRLGLRREVEEDRLDTRLVEAAEKTVPDQDGLARTW
eukprot:1708043-Pleurochrysis_carterae.AAC.1